MYCVRGVNVSVIVPVVVAAQQHSDSVARIWSRVDDRCAGRELALDTLLLPPNWLPPSLGAHAESLVK